MIFVRQPALKQVPGNVEAAEIISKLQYLWETEDPEGTLAMEEETLQCARSLLLPTSQRRYRAEAVYFY
eukprot:CAMPEP_0179492300 /NCGR_PEP_ID=MMETSP0799-20121207/66676_1 /TAXON_ID=46947 /ORGANISM="Geminigera cryophila, Strain CCMP2564" /LENGTH=68 /DNA_ID=CAMNT_0021309065 /DNA_START=105 /DNA_END=308 /DNA_ORIENTATION=+